MKPLQGITVLDFSQFLSGPSATLRLADLGARVIKVERPSTGDICRQLYISNCVIDGDSSLFHAINRNKEDIELDIKDPDQQANLHQLIKDADVIVVNFRPGVAERIGIGYDDIRALNPSVVYAQITGYGIDSPWSTKPGQDLLAQALSGVCWLNGNANQPPTPLGLSVADLFAGQLLVQGVLAALLRAKRVGIGAHVHVSLLEALLDMQFEVFTTYLNDGKKLPQRSKINNANAYIGAPYGIYETEDGYLALAMMPIPQLGELISCQALQKFDNPSSWHLQRDEIKQILVEHLRRQTTQYWLDILEPADVWCADVYTWDTLMQTEGFQAIDMVQEVHRSNGTVLQTTCCPIRIDGERYKVSTAAPRLGQDNERILQ